MLKRVSHKSDERMSDPLIKKEKTQKPDPIVNLNKNTIHTVA